MFHICISIVLPRSIQWCNPIGNLTKLFRPIWLVYMTDLTGSPRLFSEPRYLPILGANIWPLLLFLSKAWVPRNISHRPKLYWNNEKSMCTNPVLLPRVIFVYRFWPPFLYLMMTRLLLNPSCLSSSDLSMHLGSCKFPTTSSITTNFGLNKLWHSNSRSSSSSGQIDVNDG